MNKADFIKKLSKKSKLTQKECKLFLDVLISVVQQSLKNGESISLMGFGKFETRYRKPRRAYNPHTRQAINLPASKVPVFRAGKTLKDAVV